jgi:hypothetical protein
VRQDLPRAVTDLVEALLSPLAVDRPSSVSEVLRLLEGTTEGTETSSASAPAELDTRALPPPPRTAEGAAARIATGAPPPRWTHPVAVVSMVAAGLLSIAGALFVTLGG